MYMQYIQIVYYYYSMLSELNRDLRKRIREADEKILIAQKAKEDGGGLVWGRGLDGVG